MPLLQKNDIVMSLMCREPQCDGLDLEGRGKAIEHLRATHGHRFIRRPHALGVSDSRGHVWYCFRCEDGTGKDHRSFNSDRAMWDHLTDRHRYDSSRDQITDE